MHVRRESRHEVIETLRHKYLGALYCRLTMRRGPHRAAIAAAPAILVEIYHMLSQQTAYRIQGWTTLRPASRRAWKPNNLSSACTSSSMMLPSSHGRASSAEDQRAHAACCYTDGHTPPHCPPAPRWSGIFSCQGVESEYLA